MTKVGIHGKLRAQPGERQLLVEHLLEAARLMEAVEGCELYAVGIAPSEDDVVWVTEIWRSAADHDASVSLESVGALIRRARPLIAAMEGSVTFEIVGGKGT